MTTPTRPPIRPAADALEAPVLSREPAFPSNEKDDFGQHHHSHSGMSLRDYFAGQVITAVVLATCAAYHDPIRQDGETDAIPGMVRDAYDIADAMLAEREKRGGGR